MKKRTAAFWATLFCLARLPISVHAADSNQPAPDHVVLPKPVQTVEFRKALRSMHPRVFIDANGVKAFREKLKDPIMVPLWKDFLQTASLFAKATPPKEVPSPFSNIGAFGDVREIGNGLPKVAFAYLITRDPQYLEGARKWIDAIVSYPTWAGDDDLVAGHMEFGLALAYDWLYDALLSEERKAIEAKLLRQGRLLLDRSIKWGGNAWWGAAYFQNHCWINHTGVAVGAMALYDINPAEMQEWLDYTRTRFETTYRHFGVDGSYHEGPAYLSYGTQWFLYYIEALRSVSSTDLRDMPYLQNVTRHLLDVILPDGRNLANFGDSPPMGWGALAEEILPWLAARKKDGHAEWLRQKNQGNFLKKPRWSSPFSLMWFDPSVAPKPPDDLSMCGLYPDMGLVVFRSSWKDDAAVVALHCGPPGGNHFAKDWKTFPKKSAISLGHSHPDANSFLFWSAGQWRIGAPGAYTHLKKTENENVWIVGGKGQRGGDAQWFEPASYFVDGISQPQLVRVATNSAVDYVIGEAAPAYDPNSHLTEFRRHLLFVKGEKPYVVVYDRLRANEPVSWLSHLHTYGKIETTGSNSFQAMGCAPPVESFWAPASLPKFTMTYGSLMGPASTSLTTHPLNVVDHDTNKPKDKGFELIIGSSESSKTTWLVAVIGTEKMKIEFLTSGDVQPPSLMVGEDTIRWKADDNVSFNGKLMDGNLLSPP